MIEQNVIATKVGSLLRKAEASADTALADTATLLAECARSRVVLQLPAGEGQRGILALGNSITHLIKAQGELRHAHSKARQIGQTRGLAPDEEDCPWPATGVASGRATDLAASDDELQKA